MKTKYCFSSLLLCLLAASLPAQEFRATISGHVFDATGAAVPNAKVTAINSENKETATATSDASGTYTIPFLRPGDYKVTTTSTGFKQSIRDRVTLEVGRVAGLDITLEVGAVTDSVEVSAESSQLETQTASRSGVVSPLQVSELPLNARNPFMLGSMMPGVTFRGAAIWQRPFDNGAIAQWSVNGSRDSSTEFMMDGASNNGQMGGNNIAYVPIVDSVQEFSMQLNLYNSEYGHTGGGIMNVVLKSGSNDFHATGWEFLRRTPLDANTFQNNAVGAKKSEHYLDQYGFQVSGPVYIPKLLKKDGPVKLFYLGAFENYREGTPNPLIVSYPELAMRGGDFSKMVNAAGNPITIYNPFATTKDANGDPIRAPFPGNIIPANLINPIAVNVSKYFLTPNRAAPAGSRYSTNNVLLPDYFDADKFYNLILKFDWNFGDRHRAFVRHASNDRTEDRAGNGIDNKPGTDGQQPFQRINDAYVVDWTTTASPTLIFNARVSFNRFIEKGFGRANEGFDVSSFGLSKSLLSTLPGPLYFGKWNFANYASLGRSQSNNFSNTYQVVLSATKIMGKHSMKAGLDIRQINYLQENTGDILSFSGNTGWTQKTFNQGDSTSGDGYASFLLGLTDGSVNYPLFPWWKQMYFAPYFQDDWKVSRRLTVNLGIRNDLNQPPHEKWNRMNGPFDPNVASPLTSQIPAAMTALYPQLSNLKGSLTFAGVNGISSTPAKFQKNNWQPRVGFAYEINQRLVTRGGIGLYYSNPNNDFFQNAGFTTGTTLVNSNDGGRTPIANVLSNPYPNGISVPTGSSAGALTFVGRNNNWFDSNFETPRVWSFSYGFQFQATRSSTIDLSYVGSRSSNLNMSKQYNIPSAAFRKLCNIQEGGSPTYCDATLPNPFKGIAAFNGTGAFTSDTISRYNINRPFPQFNGDLTQVGRNDARIWYNSVQISYNLRMRGGLTFTTNYNFSKEVERSGFNDAFNNVYQQGIYLNDRPHVFKLTTVYELPFGTNKKFGAGTTGLAKKLISNWEMNVFYNKSSGEPADLPGNVIMLKDPKTPTANWDGNVDFKQYQVRGWNPCVLRQLNDGTVAPSPGSIAAGCGTDQSKYVWFQTASYAPRYTPNRTGEIRKNGAFTMDASINKRTQITERLSAQFGVEAFNLMNHNQIFLQGYNTDPTSPAFGTFFPSQVSTQNGMPRQLQIRMKVLW